MTPEDKKDMARKVCDAWQDAVRIAVDVRDGVDEPCFPSEEGTLVTGRQFVENILDMSRPEMEESVIAGRYPSFTKDSLPTASYFLRTADSYVDTFLGPNKKAAPPRI